MRKYMLSGLVLGLSFLLFNSCGTSTKITVDWGDKEFQKGNIDKILILGITKRPAVRMHYEDDMVKKLEYYGVEGTPSYEIFPMDEKLDTTTFRLHFKSEGFDAVLTSQLVAEDKQTRYEPGYGMAGGYNRGFYGYYGSTYDYMYSPGYTCTTTTLKIETNLYDTKTEKLIWSGISETFQPNDEMDAIRSLNKAVTSKLNSRGYFAEPKKD